MKNFQEFVNEVELKEKESWWGKKGKDRITSRRAQWAKKGIMKKKSEPEKKEKDSGIHKAAKRAGLSRSARDKLYNEVEK
jgi:hypothetical protein